MTSIETWLREAEKAEAAGDKVHAASIYKALARQGYRVTPGSRVVGAPTILDDGKGLSLSERAKLGPLDDPQKRSYLTKQYGGAYQAPDGRWAIPGSYNQYRYVNPEGLDVGDVASGGSIAAEVVGGTIGGLLGGLAGGPTVAGVPAGVIAGGAAGSQAGREGYDYLMRRATGQKDTRTPLEVTGEVVGGAAVDAVAPVVAGKLYDVSKGFLRHALGGDQARDVLDAATRQNVRTTTAMHGNENARKVEGALESLPLGGPAKKRAVVAADIERSLNTRLDAYTSLGTPQELGTYLQTAGEQYVTRWQGGAKELYGKVDALVPHNARFDTANLNRVITDRLERYAADPAYEEVVKSPLLKRLEGVLAQDDASYAALSALRSDIGKAIGDRSGPLLNDASVGELKVVYRALSDDLASGMRSVSKEAADAFDAANQHYQSGAQVISNVIDPLLGRTSRPEDIYTKLMTQSRKGGTTLQALKDEGILDAEDVDILAAGTLRFLTRPRPGAQQEFSPQTFATGVQRMSPEAQELLFNNSSLSGDVSDLRLLSREWANAGLDINRSRTAGALITANTLGGGGSVLSAGTLPMVSMLMQSDATKRVLAGATSQSDKLRLLTGMIAAQGVPAEEAGAAALQVLQQLQPTPTPVQPQQQAPTLNPAQAQPQGMLQPPPGQLPPYLMNPQSAVDPMALPQRNAPGRETRQLPAHVPQLAEWGMDPVNFLV